MPVHNEIYLYDTDKCSLCDLNVVGDEYHYLLICLYFTKSRENYMENYFYGRPTSLKFEQHKKNENKNGLDLYPSF